jgi:hypothetical protein
MLDIHPAHHAATTWKDFWIHLGTITIGLLIAIGLEQSVEALHRVHERHVLEEDLRAECERNRELDRTDIAYLRAYMEWCQKAGKSLRAATPGQPAQMPPELSNDPAYRMKYRYISPTDSVWQVAKTNGSVALLPRDEAQMFTRLDRVHELVLDMDMERRKSTTAYVSVVDGLTGEPPPHSVDLKNLSPEQLHDLSTAIQNQYAITHTLEDLFGAFDRGNQAVLDGARTEEKLMEGVYKIR